MLPPPPSTPPTKAAGFRDPLLIPLAALIAGILLAQWLGSSIRGAALATLAFALLAALSHRQKSLWLTRITVALASLTGGVLAAAIHRPGPVPQIDASAKEILIVEGCVVDPPVFAPDRAQFTLELFSHARARVTIPLEEGDPLPQLHYGDHIEFDARLRAPHNYNNPGSFDYAAYLAHQNIYWTASIRHGTEPRILEGRCGTRALGYLYALRTRALARIEQLYGSDTYSAGMMKAILLGDASALEKIWTEDFRRTGTFHALVISGVHVTVLAGVLLFLLRMGAMPKIPALAITATAAWLYALVSGMSPPVVRAAAGFTLYLAARFFFRRTRVLNLLAAIAIVYLLWDPAQIYDASFQLSFLCVAAIGALATPWLEPRIVPLAQGLRRINDLALDPHVEPPIAQTRVELRLAAETFSLLLRLPAKWLAAFFATTLRLLLYALEMAILSTVIQIGLALPMAELFHRVSFTGLTANLLIVPLLNLVVPLGFFAMFTGWHWVAGIAGWILSLSARIATWHARHEPSWRIPDPPFWLALAFLAALIFLAMVARRPVSRWPALALVVGLFGLLLWQPWPPVLTPNVLELTALDIGQGDSLFLAFPKGRLMVVDGGGILQYGRIRKARFDTGEDVVSPYLWSRGIRRIDVLVATHAHEDHTGGLKSVMENFRPAEFWVGANPPPALVKRAEELHIRVIAQHLTPAFDFSGARIQFLSPPEDYVSTKTGNNDSLAFRVTYGTRSFLLTGDLERPMEGRLLSEDGLDLHADVLKVGHHGSKTSSIPPFLDAVHPSLAIISAGYENSFGHPHPDIIHRLEERHVTILRTDDFGLVTVKTDGQRIDFDMMAWDSSESLQTHSGNGLPQSP